MAEHEVMHIPRKAPQGLRGAGWVLTVFVVFAVAVITAWAEGWDSGNYRSTAAPPTHHSMSAATNGGASAH
jgi:hypothetical protein